MAVFLGYLEAPSCTVTVGEVTALPYGSAPTVTNRGTDVAVVLDFAIPEGAPSHQAGPRGTRTHYVDGPVPEPLPDGYLPGDTHCDLLTGHCYEIAG